MDVGAAAHDSEELSMQTVTTIGLDIAKSVFQVHGVDAAGQVVVRRQLKRRYVLAFFQKLSPCLIGIEACASSHQLVARVAGTWCRLAYVKPYVKRQKNDRGPQPWREGYLLTNIWRGLEPGEANETRRWNRPKAG
jgi:hypothetical protein